MPTLTDVLGFALVGTILPAGLVTYVAWRNRRKPGAVWLALTVISLAGFASAYGLSLALDGYSATVVAANLDFLFSDLASLGWFLVTVEYVKRERLTARWPYLLFVVPAVSQALLWTNASHHLVRTSMVVDSLGVPHPTFGPWFYVHTAVNYALILSGIVLMVWEFQRSQGIRRNQTAVLLAGAIVSFVTNALYVAGVTPFTELDLTPLAFLFAATIFAYGIFRYRLLELLPIARKTAVEGMQDAMITLDEDGRVVDVNPAAADLFDLSESLAVGAPAVELFADYPEMVDQLGDAVDIDTEITITTDGDQRHFHLDVSPLETEPDLVEGTLIVLRDVTELKDREQELDLLKQVLSRVLRHNIRNDVSVVNGYAEEIAHRTSGEPAALAGRIKDKGDDIATRSQKAATIERVLGDDSERVTHDLANTVDEAVEQVRGTVGSFTVTRDFHEECQVWALPTLSIALANLIENAVIHADGSTPEVQLSIACDEETVTIEVRDDGPGIPESELSVFEHGEETPLHHSSGVGLWLVILIVRQSGGEISFENDADGSTVQLTLERA